MTGICRCRTIQTEGRACAKTQRQADPGLFEADPCMGACGWSTVCVWERELQERESRGPGLDLAEWGMGFLPEYQEAMEGFSRGRGKVKMWFLEGSQHRDCGWNSHVGWSSFRRKRGNRSGDLKGSQARLRRKVTVRVKRNGVGSHGGG